VIRLDTNDVRLGGGDQIYNDGIRVCINDFLLHSMFLERVVAHRYALTPKTEKIYLTSETF